MPPPMPPPMIPPPMAPPGPPPAGTPYPPSGTATATLAVPESRIKTLLSFLPQTGLTVQPGGGAAAPIPGALGVLVPTRAVTLRGPAEALRAVAAWVAQPAGLV